MAAKKPVKAKPKPTKKPAPTTFWGKAKKIVLKIFKLNLVQFKKK